MTTEADQGILQFAEQMLALLDRGNFVATYKYAVLLALMDLCLEHTTKDGPPQTLTTRQLAERVTELYWPHTVPYCGDQVLKQNTGTQAKILSDIHQFRASTGCSSSIHRARSEQSEQFARLINGVEWTLILMPLPRVQRLGDRHLDLIYRIGWDLSIEREPRVVRAYQRGDASSFDNRIHLLPGVGDHLTRLSGLLRPLIHREWASMVVQINKLEGGELEGFLFGSTRKSLHGARGPLLDLQEGRCFYCHERIGKAGGAEVDHFIPRIRYPNDGIHNLVATHRRCNNDKRDRLPSAAHVDAWVQRCSESNRAELASIAEAGRLPCDPQKTLGVARAVYLRLPARTLLWDGVKSLVEVDGPRLHHALTK